MPKILACALVILQEHTAFTHLEHILQSTMTLFRTGHYYYRIYEICRCNVSDTYMCIIIKSVSTRELKFLFQIFFNNSNSVLKIQT